MYPCFYSNHCASAMVAVFDAVRMGVAFEYPIVRRSIDFEYYLMRLHE